MGVNVVNHFFGPHVPAGGASTGYRFVQHKGDANTQVKWSESPDCDATVRDEIRAAAAVSQSAFNTKIGNVYGSWVSVLSADDKENMRTAARAY